jgi:hypothetical protein
MALHNVRKHSARVWVKHTVARVALIASELGSDCEATSDGARLGTALQLGVQALHLLPQPLRGATAAAGLVDRSISFAITAINRRQQLSSR